MNWYQLVTIERISNKKKKNNKTLKKLNKSKIINIQDLFFGENFSNFPNYIKKNNNIPEEIEYICKQLNI